MRRVRLDRLFVLFAALAASACSSAPPAPVTVQEWLRRAATPLAGDALQLGALDERFADAHVVGLGEATHGQHESFELKRRLTQRLIREHGYRCVAYESSAARAERCDDYIAGRSDDRAAAVRGLGMLIWQVEENAALLDDLRAWNSSAPPHERVRFIGVDAQDGEAVARALEELLAAQAGEAGAALALQARSLVASATEATQQLFSGQREAFERMLDEAGRLAQELERVADAANDREAAARLRLRSAELAAHLRMYGSPGGRDRAMAELLLAQTRARSGEERVVLWAHNAHVQRSALRHLGSDELATGGHLAAALGERYCAVGFAFGEGEFQANAPGSDGAWGFQRYRLSAAPEGSLEEQLGRAHAGDFALDLRSAPPSPAVQTWLDAGHGQRWFGGYQVPDDCDERTRDASALLQTFPRQDFDALMYLARTSAARPVDVRRILPPIEAGSQH